MRGFGILVLIVGLIAVFVAMNMDVSVASGGGRVVNLGLMSQRQNLTLVSGLFALGGLLMAIFGAKKIGNDQPVADTVARDTRPCPFCAEPIKAAAIKCRHCGSDVPKGEAAAMQSAPYGWTIRKACDSVEELERTNQSFEEQGLALIKPDGLTAICGFFQDKEDAKSAKRDLESRHSIETYLYFQPRR